MTKSPARQTAKEGASGNGTPDQKELHKEKERRTNMSKSSWPVKGGRRRQKQDPVRLTK